MNNEESQLDIQIGGDHYKDLKIQPIEYIYQNKIGFIEGSAINYLTRWRSKGWIDDLKKARHFIDMLIEFEDKKPKKKSFREVLEDAINLGLVKP